MTVSPVDAAITQGTDGSASIWVGNTDRVYGGQWRVALTLRPHRAVLEQHTSLYNGTPVRHRFYWWTNAAVRVTDESRMLYPMRFTASHGFREVDTWPVDHRGVDLSTIRTHTEGPVSLFSHGSREGFMGVYHPATDSGVVHYSPPADLPAKKFWSWGVNQDAKDWRVALSDDQSAYVEVQAGLFRNQETYAFLEPQETVSFDEYLAADPRDGWCRSRDARRSAQSVPRGRGCDGSAHSGDHDHTPNRPGTSAFARQRESRTRRGDCRQPRQCFSAHLRTAAL